MVHAETTSSASPPHAGLYLLLVAAAVGIFFAITSVGERRAGTEPTSAISAPQASGPDITSAATAKARPPHRLFHLLVALAAIVAVGRLLAIPLKYLGQPPVIGEVLAGIMLGPSLLGRLWPGVESALLPDSLVPILDGVAQLGVMLYMFVVGLEFSGARLAGQRRAVVGISHASIIVPFLLGSALALPLHARFAGPGVSFTAFALFLGVAMSITAFPVLARILADHSLAETSLGEMALACAAADDATAWCLLALAVSVTRAETTSMASMLALSAVYVAIMLAVVRPLVARATSKSAACEPTAGRPTAGGLAAVMIGLLASAIATEAIGLHAVFGAFLFGCVIPHDSQLARELVTKLKDLVSVLLLPAFFAASGLRTEIALLDSAEHWMICGLIVVVATAGKFGGTIVGARASGFSWSMSAALGALMNTRGLMELVVLNIGMDLGIISPPLFAMMVLMALVTTMLASPALRLFVGPVPAAGAAQAA